MISFRRKFKAIKFISIAGTTALMIEISNAQNGRTINFEQAMQMGLENSKQLRYSQAKLDYALALQLQAMINIIIAKADAQIAYYQLLKSSGGL